MGVAKLKKCKECGGGFLPQRPLQYLCSPICAINYTRKQTKKNIAKDWQKEKKERKTAMMTHSEWLKLLQVVFNTFIRERDKNENCISCNKSLIGDNPQKPKKFDAGHFRSVGSNPQLRFNEDNVYGQCVHCNRDKHGNLLEYRKNLIEKIGIEKVEYLENCNESNKLSIPEIQEKIKYYKDKIKQLKNENT
jgi:hypothetical protein